MNVQAGGSLLIDVERTQQGQRLNDWVSVTRNVTFEQGGGINPYVIGALRPGDTFKVIKAGGTVSGSPITIGDASPIRWSYLAGADGSLTMEAADADFRLPVRRSLTPTETAMLDAWQGAWEAGDVDASGFFGAIANADIIEDYDRAIDGASPDSQLHDAAALTLDSQAALSSALGCPAFSKAGSMLRETECAWSKISHHRNETGSSAKGDGFTDRASTLSLGAQREIVPDWFLSGVFAFTDSDGNSDDFYTRTQSNSVNVSVAVKHQNGPWLFAAAAQLGYSDTTIRNTFDIGDDVWQAQASTDIITAALRLRAAYEFAYPTWHLRPILNVDTVHTSMRGYDLSGGVFDMRVHDLDQWTFAAHPTLDAGLRIDTRGRSSLRLYSQAGLTLQSYGGLETRITVHDDEKTAFEFTSTTALPDRMASLTFGAQFMSHDRYSCAANTMRASARTIRAKALLCASP